MQLTKQVGEYLVAAKRCRRRLIATTFSGNVPYYDHLRGPFHFSVAVIMTAVLVVAARTPAAAPEPIVVNGGFEQKTDGALVGWEWESEFGSEKDYAGVDRVDYHRGSQCLKMEFQTRGSSCSFTQAWTPKKQSWYVASCYVKGWAIKPGDVRLYVLDENDKVITESSFTPRMFEWIKAATFPFNSADNKVLKVRVLGAGYTGAAWFDDVRIEPIKHITAEQIKANTPERFTLEGNSGEDGVSFHYPSSTRWVSSTLLPATVYVSPDMPLIMILGPRYNSPNFDGRGVKLFIDLPASIRIESASAADDRAYSSRDFGKKSVQRDGRSYTRHSISFSKVPNWDGYSRFFLSTSLKEGEIRKGYFHAEWPTGKQLEQSIAFESIRIKRTRPPKRLRTGMYFSGAEFGMAWPEFARSFKSLGLNTLHLSDAALATPGPAPSVDDFIKKTYADGISVMGEMSPFFGSCMARVSRTPEAQSVTFAGKHSNAICPSYRGPIFQDEVRKVRSYAHHLSWINFDSEAHTGDTPDENFCYCQRCRKGFRDFLGKRYPHLGFVDPSEFMKIAFRYPQLKGAWTDYRTDLATEWYALFRKGFLEEVKITGAKSASRPRLSIWSSVPSLGPEEWALQDYSKYAGPLDYIIPMEYYIPQVIGNGARDLIAVKGAEKNIVMGFCPASPHYELTPARTKYAVWETFANGAVGFNLWAGYYMNGLKLKYLAEAVAAVLPVEDIIMDGKPIKHLTSPDQELRVRGMEHDGQAVILASDYAAYNPRQSSIACKVSRPSKVTDLQTKQVIGRVCPSTPIFNIEIGGRERAKLLLIGEDMSETD